MNSFLNLANIYAFACDVWPKIPSNIPLTQKLLKPFRYLFNITVKCNLACPYCCQKNGTPQERTELSLQEILVIVKKLPRYAVIALSGGEPLCREDFIEIVRGIAKLNRKTALLTNGLLLNNTIICEIIEKKLLNVGVAIDGEKKYYETMKGEGNYSVLMDKIDRLSYYKKKMRSSFPKFDWKVTVFPENVIQLPKLYRQAIAYGADTFTVSFPKQNHFQFNDCLHGLEILDLATEDNNNYYPDSTYDLYDELFALSKKAKTKLRTYPLCNKANDLANYFDISDLRRRYEPCREPWSGLVISATGEVYPCLSFKIGDLRKQSLSEILMSSENIEFRKRLKDEGIFPICEGCCYAKIRPILEKERAMINA